MKIPKIKLKNNFEIPTIGLGTWQLKGETCIKIVKKAIELGYTHLDTARVYGNEAEIGKAIKTFDRKKLFITSKVWPDDLDYKNVLKQGEESLENLGIDYTDLYLIHWPRKNMDLRNVLRGFKKLQNDEKIKSFGVSNFTINHLKDTMQIAGELGLQVVNNQVEYHPLLNQEKLLKFCKENNISVTAYSPLARGEIMNNKTIQKIAEKYNKTPAQISLRWLLQKGLIVIPKSSSESHLKANIELDFKIENEDMDKLNKLNRDLRQVNPSHSEFDY